MLITTNVVSSNPTHGKVYSIQHYVIVCQWLATGQWFSLGALVSSTNKTDCHDITDLLLKVALNTITLTHSYFLCIILPGGQIIYWVKYNYYTQLKIVIHIPNYFYLVLNRYHNSALSCVLNLIEDKRLIDWLLFNIHRALFQLHIYSGWEQDQ